MGATGPTPARPQQLLEQLLESGRGERLRSELAGASGAGPALVEEAFQDACARAVTPGRCRGTSEGEVYTWLRSVALSRIRDLREHAHHRHELLVAWAGDEPDEPGRGEGADVEVLRREKERELDELAQLAVTHMTEQQRRVVALDSRQFRAKEIAQRLGTSDRSVARIKEKAYGRARHTLVGAAGGGCAEGERLVSRLAFGTANPAQRGEAQRELWWPGKTPQAARRRLVKLFRGGYLERFRPYSPRGSYEWTYYLAAHGHRLLRDVGALDPDARFKPREVFDYGRALHDVQVNAWVLAYRRLLGPALVDWQGEHQLTPSRTARQAQRPLDDAWSIEGLRDPHPRPVVPDATLKIADDRGEGDRTLLLEYDRTSRTDKNFDKFRRYDNLVTTWWSQTQLADHGEAPYVLFICQDERQRDDFLDRADHELTGHRWHPNHPAEPHQYVGRRHVLFCDERDIHHRHLEARRLPPYPPGHPARNGPSAEIRGVRLPGGEQPNEPRPNQRPPGESAMDDRPDDQSAEAA